MRRQALTLPIARAAAFGAAVFAAATLVLVPAARAQPMAQPSAQPMMAGGMPDLTRIVGKPLPDAGMPAGTLSVRVARKLPVNAVAGAEVAAVIQNAGGDARKRTAKTDGSGRAMFEGIAPGDTVKVTVDVDGEALSSSDLRMPPTGGLKTMLIAGLRGAGGGDAEAAGGEGEGEGEAGAGEPGDSGARFTMGATAGNAFPEPGLPVGRLEVHAFDENGAPIPNHPILLGMVGKGGKVEVKKAVTDGSGMAGFSDLPNGEGTGFAAVAEWRGMRLGTTAFAMPKESGARAEIRALARTSDPSVITVGTGGRIIVFLHEDRLVVREMLPLENVSDRMFDPGAGAVEIPLPKGHVGTEINTETERKVEVRKDHGVAVHGLISPKSAMIATPGHETGNEVDFMFALPFDAETREIEQPMPTGMGPFTLIIQIAEGRDLGATGPGVGTREQRPLNGRNYWVMPVAAVPTGGTLKFTLTGLPATDSTGRNVAGVLALLLIAGAIILGRKPRSSTSARGSVGAGSGADDERSRLVDRREALFTSLVTLEQEARSAGKTAPAERRKQLVAELEQVYRRLAAQDEQRAA